SVMPGHYQAMVLALPNGWRVGSVIAGGIDISDTGFDVRPGENIQDLTIRLTDRATEISRAVRDRSGRALTELLVVASPTARALWSSPRRVRPPISVDKNGTYRIQNLPPGEYFLALATDVEEEDLGDSRVLEALASGAVKVTVVEGDRKTQNLIVSR